MNWQKLKKLIQSVKPANFEKLVELLENLAVVLAVIVGNICEDKNRL